MKQDETYNLINHIKLEKKETYQDGDRVGTSYIYLDDIIVKEVPIYAKRNKQKKQNFLSKLRKWLT